MTRREDFATYFRSFRSTDRLVAERDVRALTIRSYRTLGLISVPAMVVGALKYDDTPEPNVIVDLEEPLGAWGLDKDTNQKVGTLNGASNVAQIHLGTATTRDTIVEGLGEVARTIGQMSQKDRPPYVAGVTYEELGRTARGFGFHVTRAIETDPDREDEIFAMHRVHTRLNGKPDHEPEPVIVHLPTNAFLQRFGNGSIQNT